MVAPKLAHVAALQVPGLSDQRSAAAMVDGETVGISKLVAEALWNMTKSHKGEGSSRSLSKVQLKYALEIAKFPRLQWALAGGKLSGSINGTLTQAVVPADSTTVPLTAIAELFAS